MYTYTSYWVVFLDIHYTMFKIIKSSQTMNTKTISEWVHDVHQTAIEKGWFEEERQRLELHMLMVSEISEATEEIRKHKPSFYLLEGKPEGEAIELVDVVLRIFDYAGYKKIDLVSNLKLEYKNYTSNNSKSESITVDFENLNEISNSFLLASNNEEWFKIYKSFVDPLEKHMLFTMTISKASEAAVNKDFEMEALYLTRTLIQILVYFKDNAWNINEVLNAKHTFNMARAYKHGGKKC
jgi:NTP pyrophosphatase (non-canonical NTP hydrolase)